MGDIVKKLMPIFLAETRERLAVLEGFAASNATGAAAFNELKSAYRAAHTIKGTAGLVKLPTTRAIAGELEDVLTTLLKTRRVPAATLKQTLTQVVSQLQQQVALVASEQPERPESADLVSALLQPPPQSAPATPAPPPATTAPQLEALLEPLPEVESGRVNVCCQFQRSAKTYSVPLADMLEISALTTLIPLPLAPPYVLGLCSLRSQVMPVIDMASLHGHSSQPWTNRNLVITECAGEKLAFLADAIPSLEPEFSGETLDLKVFVQEYGIRGD